MKTLISVALFACTFVTTAFADWRPMPPPPPGWGHPVPPPWGHPVPPPPPPPPPRTDLGGYCSDMDHSQFAVARDFAYSGNGLNLDSNQAVQWALDYNTRHACGTINEFAARYRSLYEYAYAGQYMNMDSASAQRYALTYVETMRLDWIQYWKTTFLAVYQLMYAGQYFNDDAATAVAAARTWNERGYCGDAGLVQQIQASYQQQYQFAYGSNGLNYDSARAKQYAIAQIYGMTRCSDLFR
jgi:hypothetical protein